MPRLEQDERFYEVKLIRTKDEYFYGQIGTRGRAPSGGGYMTYGAPGPRYPENYAAAAGPPSDTTDTMFHLIRRPNVSFVSDSHSFSLASKTMNRIYNVVNKFANVQKRTK